MAGLLCRIEYVLESLMEHHLDNSTFESCLMYTQATLRKVLLKFNIEVQSLEHQGSTDRSVQNQSGIGKLWDIQDRNG